MSTKSQPVIELTSEAQLVDSFNKLCDAGGAVIQIRSRETIRTAMTLRKALLSEADLYTHREWDVVNGFRDFTLENYTHSFVKGGDEEFYEALKYPLDKLREPSSAINTSPEIVHCFVFVDPHPYIDGNPIAASMIQQYAAGLPSLNVCLVFITPDVSLSNIPTGTVLLADMSTPTQAELAESLNRLLDNVNTDDWDGEPEVYEDDIDRIALLGLGMSRYEFETHAALAMVEASAAGESRITAEHLSRGIAAGKTEVVKQSDVLELFPTEDMENVGGMAGLKAWVEARSRNFTDEAKAFGIEPPKGIAIVGVPGAGKSLVAKAVAGGWGVPLIRLDFGNVFSKFVGDSESRMRSALNMVSRMGRLVLFADEIDKGLGGIGGGGDSGVSSRVLGAFLTWMQENKSDVFVILTANRIQGLPPELFRRGRLDEVFSVGLPTARERVEVLAVHLRKRGRDIKDFSKADVALFSEKSEGFLPAEIEAAVKDGLIIAFNDNLEDPSLKMRHIVEAMKSSVPMSVSHKSQIDDILEWASKNAKSVSEVAEVSPETAGPRGGSARRIARPRPSHLRAVDKDEE